MLVECTGCAIRKVKEYANLTKDAAIKMIQRSSINGVNVLDLPSTERKYYEKYINFDKRTAYVFSGYCFIFANEYCVNVLKALNSNNMRCYYNGKEKIKHPNRYLKHYDISECWSFE